MEPGAPVEIIFDPHVANACVALLLALVAALVAWVLGMPNHKGPHGPNPWAKGPRR